MKNFYLVENSSKASAAAAGKRIARYLEERGAKCTRKSGYADAAGVPADTECVIVLGGDGTVIRVSDDLAELQLPVIGFNLGHLGYLTNSGEEEAVNESLEALLSGDYRIEERCMLMGTWTDEDGTHSARALNEIVIGRKMTLHPVRLHIRVNGEFLNEYSADGIIIATPTGSTAYTLSAGGPIVEADSEMMVITPVCPHALVPSSIVLSMNNVPEIEVVGGDESGQIAVFDGDVKAQLSIGSRVRVEKCPLKVRMIRIGQESFISDLQRKLGELQG